MKKSTAPEQRANAVRPYIRPLQLTPRLLAVAALIRPGDRVLDIGTDHARLPVYLTERSLCAAVTATDIAGGPLARAARTVRAHRLEGKVTLLLRDGADGLSPDDYDTVTVTGMGGDTILTILQKSPWLSEKRLILQPQTRLAAFAAMLGRAPSRTVEVAEGRRRYTVFLFEA
ncbi:MAG: class I SAM-dependent methyltransferase [Oscillospiraceae bacterium]|nr:class I SAM-dependent methyltransferase [Oscillospiraceae bacterium]